MLVKSGLEVGLPPVKLACTLQQHLAPRSIQASSFTAQPVSVYKSILAGCKACIGITRAYLKPGISSVHEKYPDANTSVLVDDTCMQAIHEEFDGVLDIVVPAVIMFGEKARKLKLSLSNRAKVTASTPKLAQTLVNELENNYGMFFQVDPEARDLGVTHTAGASRPSKLVISRFVKSRKRVEKTKQLARITRRR